MTTETGDAEADRQRADLLARFAAAGAEDWLVALWRDEPLRLLLARVEMQEEAPGRRLWDVWLSDSQAYAKVPRRKAQK